VDIATVNNSFKRQRRHPRAAVAVSGSFLLARAGAATTGVAESGSASDSIAILGTPLYGISAIDSTVAQELVVTFEHSAAATNITSSPETVVVEKIQ